MIKKIKKLLLSSNRDDQTLGLSWLVKQYTREEFRSMIVEGEHNSYVLKGFPSAHPKGGPNKVEYKDFTLYISWYGGVGYADEIINSGCHRNFIGEGYIKIEE